MQLFARGQVHKETLEVHKKVVVYIWDLIFDNMTEIYNFIDMCIVEPTIIFYILIEMCGVFIVLAVGHHLSVYCVAGISFLSSSDCAHL
jgi:hypothetical protein